LETAQNKNDIEPIKNFETELAEKQKRLTDYEDALIFDEILLARFTSQNRQIALDAVPNKFLIDSEKQAALELVRVNNINRSPPVSIQPAIVNET
jgi:hypothetical protein